MERWFTERRRSKILELAYRQITLAIDTVTDLKKAITAASQKSNEETKEHIERLFVTETEIDNLRRAVFEEATKGELPTKTREDLLHLVKRLDILADYVKDSARNTLLLLDADIPDEIWNICVETMNDLEKCATILRRAIEKLGTDPSEARKLAEEIDKIEGEVDNKHLKAKWLLLQHANELNAAVIVLLKDLIDFLEHIADTCDDTADYVRVLTVPRY